MHIILQDGRGEGSPTARSWEQAHAHIPQELRARVDQHMAMVPSQAYAVGHRRMSMKNMSIAVADSMLSRFPDPDSIPYRPWCYAQGYLLAGLEKL